MTVFCDGLNKLPFSACTIIKPISAYDATLLNLCLQSYYRLRSKNLEFCMVVASKFTRWYPSTRVPGQSPPKNSLRAFQSRFEASIETQRAASTHSQSSISGIESEAADAHAPDTDGDREWIKSSFLRNPDSPDDAGFSCLDTS